MAKLPQDDVVSRVQSVPTAEGFGDLTLGVGTLDHRPQQGQQARNQW